MYYFLSLVFLVIPYYQFFCFMEQARLQHKMHKNVFNVELPPQNELTKQATLKDQDDAKSVESKRSSVKMEVSFNSSDMEAYKDEQPIPVFRRAFLKYQRQKTKAQMRRGRTDLSPGSSE